jgi:hypothetical protein
VARFEPGAGAKELRAIHKVGTIMNWIFGPSPLYTKMADIYRAKYFSEDRYQLRPAPIPPPLHTLWMTPYEILNVKTI